MKTSSEEGDDEEAYTCFMVMTSTFTGMYLLMLPLVYVLNKKTQETMTKEVDVQTGQWK